MGTRDNGLRAASYTPLGEVVPDQEGAALGALRTAGVAAYVVGEAAVGERVVLWVDSAASARARSILARGAQPDTLGPAAGPAPRGAALDPEAGGAATHDEATWAAIVASFEAASAPDVPPWPASEDVEPDDRVQGKASADEHRSDRLLRAAEPEPPADRPAELAGAEGGTSDEEHFVPPPPPPVPRADRITRWAWAGLMGGPTFLFGAALASAHLADWVAFLAVAAFVTGFVTLVARMKDRPPRDSGGDDGAVV